MFIVLVPPDKNHGRLSVSLPFKIVTHQDHISVSDAHIDLAEKMTIHLKDIGTGLVANLNLLSDFARAIVNVSEWWTFMKEDLESPKPTSIPSPTSLSSYTQDEVRAMKTRWSALKEGFQQYYDIVRRSPILYYVGL